VLVEQNTRCSNSNHKKTALSGNYMCLHSKYELDRLIFKLCSSQLKVFFQVSYKFAYRLGLKLVYCVLEIACELV
jgi:hypothetical protein